MKEMSIIGWDESIKMTPQVQKAIAGATLGLDVKKAQRECGSPKLSRAIHIEIVRWKYRVPIDVYQTTKALQEFNNVTGSSGR